MATVIKLPKLHSAQRQCKSARFTIYNCGRRFGKDVLLMYRLVKKIAEGKPLAWFAPEFSTMKENYEELKRRVYPIIARSSDSDHRIEIINGTVIEFWSLKNFNSARGRKYAHATINEAAASPYLLDAWNFVIRPTLADYRGTADFASTPRGLNGFHTIYQNAADSDWAVNHFTTLDNPYIPPEEVAAMKAALPDRVYRQEILAEFLHDGAFFQNVYNACTLTDFESPEDHRGHYIVAGLDWGQSNDFTVLTIYCARCKKCVEWLRTNKVSYSVIRSQVGEACKRWNADLLPERNSIGGPNIEAIWGDGVSVLSGGDGKLGFHTSAESKQEIILRLAAAIERGEISAPADYAEELSAFEAVFAFGRGTKFGAPHGLHDDRVISLALALQAATGGESSVLFGA